MPTGTDVAKKEYSDNADEYVVSKTLPWRKHIEEFSLKKTLAKHFEHALGHNKLDVLELACGAGYYSSKILDQWGTARFVFGVDLSEDMIERAKQVFRDDNRASFIVADCGESPPRKYMKDLNRDSESFDLCFAAYLLNYATDKDMLLRMCQTIRANLRPGGLFLSVNDGSYQTPESFGFPSNHGFTKVFKDQEVANGSKSVQDFEPLVYRFKNSEDGSSFDITNYRISPETFEWAFKEAGFSHFQLLPSVADPSVEKDFQDLISIQPVMIIEAIV